MPRRQRRLPQQRAQHRKQQLPIGATKPNQEHIKELNEALNDFLRILPDIVVADPLPVVFADPVQLTGCQTPFNVVDVDSKFAQADVPEGTRYNAGINFFWMWSLQSLTPWTPMYRPRMLDLGGEIFHRGPALVYEPFHVVAIFENGDRPPEGDLPRISPDELGHAPIFVLSERIRAGAPDQELNGRRRVLLFVPVCLEACATEYAT